MSSPAAPQPRWPLGRVDAQDAAASVARPLAKWPEAQELFMRGLASKFFGAADKADMVSRLDEFMAEFREHLPAEFHVCEGDEEP